MIIDATFWVAISFIIFLGLIIYFKIPGKIKSQLDENINDIKNLFNIQYLAPCDIKEIENKKMVFDSCISSTTLEHLSLKQLSDTFLRLKKIIKKDGIMIIS